MKNELQQHKKSDSIKWIVVFVLIGILAFSMIGLMVKTSIDLSKPDLSAGIKDELPSTEEPSECEHQFEYGVCTECGVHIADIMPMATKTVSTDEKCVINYWTADYELIKSETVDGGSNFKGITGYNFYYLLTPNTVKVSSYADASEGDILINGKFNPVLPYYGSITSDAARLTSLYPVYIKATVDGNSVDALNIHGYPWIYGRYNGKYVGLDDTDQNYIYTVNNMDANALMYLNAGDNLEMYLKEGDEFEFLSYNFYSTNFVRDRLMYSVFSSTEARVICDIDVINVVVINYSGEVA